METQQTVVLFVALVLVAAAVYFTLGAESPVEPTANESEQDEELKIVEGLLFKGLEFGKGQGEYAYSFTETSNDYQVTYTLVKKGNVSMVRVENPLSEKEAYFLDNDTILCVNYTDHFCSSVGNVAEVENYLESLEVELFDDARIDKDMASMRMLIDKKYVTLSPDIQQGDGCSELTYRLDFSGVTLSEAALFGIGSNSPKVFDFEMCVNNETGQLHKKKFNYSWQETEYVSEIVLVSFESSAPDIELPLNVGPGAVAELRKEREQAVKLAKCFTDNEGEEREKCISVLALQLKDRELCYIAGARKDRCIVSLVPMLEDETLCPLITDASFKDDCYIELAGALKNSTYCSMVANQSKMELCQNASAPPEDDGEDFEIDIEDFMDYIEDYDANETAAAPENNQSGNESH
jgi:hypothetical protein